MIYQYVFISIIKVRLRGRINTYYELCYTSLCENRLTYLNTYYELGYFQLNTSETCQQESDTLINRVKANQSILAQTCL